MWLSHYNINLNGPLDGTQIDLTAHNINISTYGIMYICGLLPISSINHSTNHVIQVQNTLSKWTKKIISHIFPYAPMQAHVITFIVAMKWEKSINKNVVLKITIYSFSHSKFNNVIQWCNWELEQLSVKARIVDISSIQINTSV